MKRWSIFLVLILLVACSDTDEAQQTVSSEPASTPVQTSVGNEASVESDTNAEQDDSDKLASGYTAEEEVRMAIENMYEWQSYHANYLFTYEIEGVENYNLIETEYVASSPVQKHSIITTPYFVEEYYAIEDVGVYSYTDYTEVWKYDENTDIALEDDLIYSMSLMNKIVDTADQITITQDIDSPNFANIIFKEDVNLFEEFRFYLSARTETVQDIMFANVIDVSDGEAYIYYLDNNVVYYKLLLNVIFEDNSTGVLLIEEDFDRINEIEEIELPGKVHAG